MKLTHYKILQAASAPSLLLAVSSFKKGLTFTITYPNRAMRHEDVERFVDTFLEELLKGAGVHFTARQGTAHPVPHLPSKK